MLECASASNGVSDEDLQLLVALFVERSRSGGFIVLAIGRLT